MFPGLARCYLKPTAPAEQLYGVPLHICECETKPSISFHTIGRGREARLPTTKLPKGTTIIGSTLCSDIRLQCLHILVLRTLCDASCLRSQMAGMHFCVSMASPLQFLPSYTGEGSVHVRVLYCVLFKQGPSHLDHGDHGDHPPFTEKRYTRRGR